MSQSANSNRSNFLSEFATYTFFPFGLTATPQGPFPTFTVAVTLFVVVSITEIVLLLEFVTYTFVPAGFTATPGPYRFPCTVAVIVFVAVSITTKFLSQSTTYANGAAPAILTSINSASAVIPKVFMRVCFWCILLYIISYPLKIRR